MDDLNRLKDLLRSGRIARRDFLRQASALGVTTALGTALTAGLVTASGALPAHAATPRKGGHMRFGMGHGDTSDSLDPAHVNNGFTVVMHYTISNTLTEVDAAGRLLPKLAESWEASADASQWRFKLRSGLTFHDGRPVTPADVVAAINHHRGPDSTSTAKPIVEPITSVKAEGPLEVVVTLAAGDADFPFKLSSFNFPIYPANADGTLDWLSGNGCGPYKLKKFEPGIRADFERNPAYWQAGDRAHFDSCELLAIVDVTARQNALISGEVDAIDRIDLKTADRLAALSNVEVREVEGKTHYTFPMRTDTAPFDDINVRMALKHALDRQALLDTILYGHGTIGNDHPISPAYGFHASDIPQTDYDPDKAKHYLKQAGLSSLEINLSGADAAFAGAVDACVLYQEHAAKAGINIEVVREPSDGYWSNVWMQKPWSACYWYGTPTADGIFTQAYSAGAAWNDSYWNNPRFNELLVAARAELDNARRMEMYREMQLLVHSDGGVVIPLFANDVFAVSDKVGHGDLANNLEVDGRMFFERWWFNKS
ncbi:ABC transporter substrate-binding protein [Limibacillus halophilus]|uniref:Peptide/nickel transport system substrate-binding protein n=1 Tax=Limibacillus halophilus TaxID=1579333 RepID=A0A839SMW1_9PROT|nr:ABC transporter substrate-binding protein [Limibacillus halophilus]MBB3064161.1 peptide/nickel transport system substrate-binding protein [Limibacillus halophilus]